MSVTAGEAIDSMIAGVVIRDKDGDLWRIRHGELQHKVYFSRGKNSGWRVAPSNFVDYCPFEQHTEDD